MNIHQFTGFILGSFIALFPIVDPIGNIPTFLVLTARNSIKERHEFARRIASYTVLFLTLFHALSLVLTTNIHKDNSPLISSVYREKIHVINCILAEND